MSIRQVEFKVFLRLPEFPSLFGARLHTTRPKSGPARLNATPREPLKPMRVDEIACDRRLVVAGQGACADDDLGQFSVEECFGLSSATAHLENILAIQVR